jgi:hypothetical protein
MTRRFWLRCVAWSLGWLGTTAGWNWHLASVSRADQQQANLNETLRSVLKCRRPQEFAYVDLVTQKVQQGDLPLALVLSMMQWARKRARQEIDAGRRKTDIPFPYFQQGLKLRAAEIGVDLPAFNVEIGP